jgi:HEAT repeat protein
VLRVELATEGLEDPEPRLRRTAAYFAWRDDLVPPIEACLRAFTRDVSWWGRRCGADLVLRHGDTGRAALERVLDTGSADERSTAALALAGAGSKAAFEVLKQELLRVPADRKWTRAVSHTLARVYGDEVARWLGEAGGEAPELGRALWTMARSRAHAGPMVEGLFQDGPPSVRAAATRILARERGPGFLPELRARLAEGRPRKVAQEAFWQMHHLRDAARPTVVEMLASAQWTERKAAVCLLRRWGELSPEQRRAAEADEHVAVRHAAGRKG